MLCPSCHANVPAGQRFCGSCGTKIEIDDDVTVTSDAATRLAGTPESARTEAGGASSGWLSSSGSIDHGRFGPGTVLDSRYRIIGLLGRGGMGEVYRADDLRLGQPVALKFLPQALAGDARRLAQLHNEVRTARQVSHASVCRVYDIGEVDGQLFLTMEYVDGEDLAASLRRIGRFPEDKALEIARQICGGLAAAHDRGVIHRDLKPANIMIDAQGRVRIMDFGLAAAGAVEDVRVGTPAYMAPEQLEGREVSTKCDIYALGLVLYELFTGRRAFTATTLADLVEQQASGTITAPTELVKGLDPAIERAIERCLERDPAGRPATVLAVSASLPGGDPLAAALAAGETPSPEMLAAAGGDAATVSSGSGVRWLAAAAILALAVVAITDRVSMLSRTPFAKPAAVLADRAEELRQALGYTEPVVDQAFGFVVDVEYLAWADNHGSAAARWPELADGRPAPLRFWYRTSPRLLSPMNSAASRSLGDPPFGGASGMTTVQLDTKGRLLSFEVMPRQIDPAEQIPAPTVDWLAIFTMAGLDPAAFTEVDPGRTPRTFADARHAWRGPLPGTAHTVTVEAASYRGRPVYFDIIGPWTSAPRDPGAESAFDGNGPGAILLVVILLVVAVLLTRVNVKSGRADLRGAFRLAAFMVGLTMSWWLLQPHVRALADERSRLFAAVGSALFQAGAMFVLYLAVEPHLRRIWPTALMSWSRLLTGRLRDAFIGRDLLIGIACGLAMTLLDRLDKFMPVQLGWPEPIPYVPLLSALLGLRPAGAAVLNSLNAGVQQGLITVLSVALLRTLVHLVMSRFAITRPPVDAVMSAIAIAAVSVATAIDYTGDMRHMWLPLLTAELSVIIVLFLVSRVGILAAIFAYAVNFLTNRIPLTFDGSRYYAGEGWVVLLGLVALSVIGYRWARAGARAAYNSSVMKRRTLLQSVAALFAVTPFARVRLAAQSPAPPAAAPAAALTEAHIASLTAMAEVVLPGALGRAGRDKAVAEFAGWVRSYKEGADRGHSYGASTLSAPSPASPAARYPPQFAALDKAALAQGATTFAVLPPEKRQVVIEAALTQPQAVTRLPARPTGANLVADFMGFFLNSADGFDLAYNAAIGRDTCRGLDGSDRAPEPLTAGSKDPASIASSSHGSAGSRGQMEAGSSDPAI